ncbi:transketolase [Streptomyces sp. NPDC093064]|uniref:transketolase n=1 Tax=Streptomyces sp. NPDC093064 TaxID=3366020 RepID=UPI003810487A
MNDQVNQPATHDADQRGIDTIRTLSMDAVQAAESGHPGTPMALSPVAYCLWQRYLRFDPADPIWPDRDRFVLSNGHASMLLYSLLHLTGVRAVNPKYEAAGKPSVTLEDIKTFRQIGSRCPGHPEYRWTSGVETTTGPLGQGVATSVGMAAAGRWLAERYNKPGFRLFDYDVYALMGDGCMMEGISSEAASLAGHLRLDNLCWIYDNNHITIEGSTALAFSDDVAARFQSYGWDVTRVGDANDLDLLSKAFDTFRETSGRPTLIIVDTHIGYGAPHKHDTAAAHGKPLGEDEVRAAKRFYGWPEEAHFLVPDGVYEHFQEGIGRRGAKLRAEWFALFERYRQAHPELADEVYRMNHRQLPDGWDSGLPSFPPDPKGLASRESSGQVLNALARNIPWLLGGAADLYPSTKTRLTFAGAGDFEAGSYTGRNFHFGIREHAMCAITNGMALTKVRPFASGFLIFTDYARGAMRLSALMEIPVIYIWSHDSISLGEDGPTHQPIEQLASLRAMPGILVIRPADANEVAEAWRVLMPLRHEPAVLVLSRQALPTLDRSRYAAASGLARGGYVLADPPGAEPDVILIGTGSEVALCVAAHEALTEEGIAARVVSMPCWELFEKQDQAYRDEVLPPRVRARVAVEEAADFGWSRYVGLDGTILGMETFGASAPIQKVQAKFGFEPAHVIQAARDQLARRP